MYKEADRKGITFEIASDRMKSLGNKIVEGTYVKWQEPCEIIFKDGTVSTKHSPCDINQMGLKSKPNTQIREHTFETASKRLKPFGTIDEKSFKGMRKICKFTFIDGTVSTKHSPKAIKHSEWKSKPETKTPKHTFETASKQLKRLGTIDEKSYSGWKKLCKFTFIDGTLSTKHSPYIIECLGRKSKPRVREHTFETASKQLKRLGTIDEKSYSGWKKLCKFTFKDGTVSTEHSPIDINQSGWKSKPKIQKHTFESASERLKPFGTIDEKSFKGWEKPCKFTFIDGTVSTKHTPHEIKHSGHKSKPKAPHPKHTFESASKRLKPFGTIDEKSFKGWQEPCKFTFIDGTVSTKHSPCVINQCGWKSKPNINVHTFETASKQLKRVGTIDEKSFKGWGKPCKFTFKDGTVSTKHSPMDIKRFGYKTKPDGGFDVEKPGYLYFFAYKVSGKTVAYKIGITNNNVINRFCGINNNLKDKSRGSVKHCDALFYFPDGHNCLDAETEIKREFERVVIDNVVSGKDEMFSKDGGTSAYLFVKMLRCCNEVNIIESKRPEVKQLVKHIAKNSQ